MTARYESAPRRHHASTARPADPVAGETITCPRCACRYDALGALEWHLRYDHRQADGRARAEAVEAATGGSVDPDTGRCRDCHRRAEDPHSPGCPIARRRGLPTSEVTPARTPERRFFVRWAAHLPVAEHAAFLEDLAALMTVVQAREREGV